MPQPSDDKMREAVIEALTELQPSFQPLIDALYAAVETTQFVEGISNRLGFNTMDNTEEVLWFQRAARLSHRLEVAIEELQMVDGEARGLLGE